jgi:hypothetical protein
MRKLPRFVHGYLDRHGKPRHYLRRPGRKAIALPGLPWSAEFMAAYAVALNEAAPVVIGAKLSVPGTVAEAVARYLGSAAFVSLAPGTQRIRRALLERFRIQHGDKRIRSWSPSTSRACSASSALMPNATCARRCAASWPLRWSRDWLTLTLVPTSSLWR